MTIGFYFDEHMPRAVQKGMEQLAGRTQSRSDHNGLICLSESLRTDIGGIIRLLTQFANDHTADEVIGRVF